MGKLRVIRRFAQKTNKTNTLISAVDVEQTFSIRSVQCFSYVTFLDDGPRTILNHFNGNLTTKKKKQQQQKSFCDAKVFTCAGRGCRPDKASLQGAI